MRALIVSVLAVGCAMAQDENPDRLTVNFSDPSKPRLLKVDVLQGSITVRGYNGKEAVIEARNRGSRRTPPTPPAAGGLRRITPSGSGLEVEEANNVIKVETGHMRTVDLVIQVPYETSVKLESTNAGNIEVEGVTGEIDVENTNGNVTVRNVSGAVVAHALNGRVVVVMDKVTGTKPMSFSSLNGDIDVTLPPDVKARVKMKTDNGDIYTDFDVTLAPNDRKPVVDETAGKRGRYRVRFDRAVYGTINGGGTEMQFTTLNGRIYIRKKGQ
ncbi:MAG: DUF4097 family beta strand repeat-containing protein [Bryobacteraceae bacterium]|nr:DUF4097 family beta strand repeat-containing protein [Bryobacteraceae bacterium]